MIALKRILFPTDFSENSREAEHYACALASQFNTELHVINILEEMIVTTALPGAPYLGPSVDLEEVRRSVEKALLTVPDPKLAGSLQVRRAIRTGNPFVEIVRYAREHEIDLIVLGTHGRTGLTHVLLGSVAEHVVRTAGCPVLTVRPKTHRFVMP